MTLRVAVTIAVDPKKDFPVTKVLTEQTGIKPPGKKYFRFGDLTYRQQYKFILFYFHQRMTHLQDWTIESWDATAEFHKSGKIHGHFSVYLRWDHNVTTAARLAVKNDLEVVLRDCFGGEASALVKPEFTTEDGKSWDDWILYQYKNVEDMRPLGIEPFVKRSGFLDKYIAKEKFIIPL